MNVLELTALLGAGACAAGFVGALTGLGGGVVIVPLLTLGLGVDIRYAVGTALVSVIATSSGAAAAYVKEGFSNLRLGIFFEVATTLGALGGAIVAAWAPTNAIAIVFGLVLLSSAAFSWQRHPAIVRDAPPGPLAVRLKLTGTLPEAGGTRAYAPRKIPLAFGLMGVAGVLSGLLGIGSGAFKVLAMDRVMQLPYKVSTTTSNFMIGVTAAASAGIYVSRGYVDPGLAMPVVLGVLAGAALGTRVLATARAGALRFFFTTVIVVLALEMIVQGWKGTV
ncbi:MAG TPA: sulfite exporter TauE/SafE family protein [Thermoanaerobaculia bacterium]|nr:sulfite exporter TauE/SafE family protein [Thermoanaerobaculia bacterium]